jgi:hypothetical protein
MDTSEDVAAAPKEQVKMNTDRIRQIEIYLYLWIVFIRFDLIM